VGGLAGGWVDPQVTVRMGVQLAGKTEGMLHRNNAVMYARAEISNLISSFLIYHNFISYMCFVAWNYYFNPLNAELNPIRHLLILAGAHHFVHVSRIRVKEINEKNFERDAGGTDEVYDRPLE
jgi:hypothetical protein